MCISVRNTLLKKGKCNLVTYYSGSSKIQVDCFMSINQRPFVKETKIITDEKHNFGIRSAKQESNDIKRIFLPG